MLYRRLRSVIKVVVVVHNLFLGRGRYGGADLCRSRALRVAMHAHALDTEHALHGRLTLGRRHRAANLGELQVLLVRHSEGAASNFTLSMKSDFVIDTPNV